MFMAVMHRFRFRPVAAVGAARGDVWGSRLPVCPVPLRFELLRGGDGAELVKFFVSFRAAFSAGAAGGGATGDEQAGGGRGGHRGRVCNLDPGIITHYSVILATTKGYAHRIYLGEGSTRSPSLLFRRGAVEALPWRLSRLPDPGRARFLQGGAAAPAGARGSFRPATGLMATRSGAETQWAPSRSTRRCRRRTAGNARPDACLAFAAALVQERRDRPIARTSTRRHRAARRVSRLPAARHHEQEAELGRLRAGVAAVDFPESAERLGATLVGERLGVKSLGRDFLVGRDGSIVSDCPHQHAGAVDPAAALRVL